MVASNINLVPPMPGHTPNYWMTWGVQNYEGGLSATGVAQLEGAEGAQRARLCLTEQRVFGEQGWLATFHPSIRSDLYALFDDGWDVPLADIETCRRWFGSVELNEERFPSCTGTPMERLHRLNAMAQSLGWRGAGLWIAAQEAPVRQVFPGEREAYWRERLSWSAEAGISYWKVDWGTESDSDSFRRMLTRLAHEVAPGLWVEHATGGAPLNGGLTSGRCNQDVVDRMVLRQSYSDVFRSYDVTIPLSLPTTLERIARILAAAGRSPQLGGSRQSSLLNCEDEPTVAATLGYAMGIWCFPISRPREEMDFRDWFLYGGARFAPTRPLFRQMDQVTRAVRWQRIMPAFGIGEVAVSIDAEYLWDAWRFVRGETWLSKIVGQTVVQGAPARIARGLPLPDVRAEGDRPYVLAARHPNGAVGIATLGRVQPDRGYHLPLADVQVSVSDATGPFGIFGQYRSLTLCFDHAITGRRVWAQDLVGDQAQDISSCTRQSSNTITLDGALITDMGLADATPGDLSEPGLLLALM